MTSQCESYQSMRASITAAGFRPARNGVDFRRAGLALTCADDWLTIRAKAKPSVDLLRGQLGRIGLWKTVTPSKPQRTRREFHLPLAALTAGSSWGSADDVELDELLVACLHWAEVTARDELPHSWRSPPRDQVASWVPEGRLALQRGPLLLQGSLVHTPERLALCFPIVAQLAAPIGAVRRQWLRQVLVDAANRWRLVRVGLAGPVDQPSIQAEVDFSGAPLGVLETLFRTGLDAICFVVSSILWPVVFLSDPRVSCRAWETRSAGVARRK